MRFEVSFKFSLQNPFLSMKMKVKSFQISLAGVPSTSPRLKSRWEVWLETRGLRLSERGGTTCCTCRDVSWAGTNLPQAFRGLISSGGLAHYLLRAQACFPLALM